VSAITESFAARLAELGHEMANLAQVQCPLTHRFAPGVYLREISMPAGTVVIGKVHKTEHFNVLIQGACLIAHPDGRLEELRAPMTFVSKAGVQKALYILEDMIWQTIHPTSETDMTKLAELLVEPCEFAVPQVQADSAKIAEDPK
jgi:hypothetical protein